MGRILTSVVIRNTLDPAYELRCDALVDTGAGYLTLPTAWRERLGTLPHTSTAELEQSGAAGDVLGHRLIAVRYVDAKGVPASAARAPAPRPARTAAHLHCPSSTALVAYGAFRRDSEVSR